MSYDELCKNALELDPQIRFAGVLSEGGELLNKAYKEGVEKLLSPEEVRMSFHYTIQRRENVSNLAHKLGKEQSSITKYEMVTMITIPLSGKELLLLSTEPSANYFEIINKTTSLMEKALE